jgi:hypothetical protein
MVSCSIAHRLHVWKIKQNRQVTEGRIFTYQMVKSEGDTFLFDDYKAQALVPHQ